MSEETEIRKVTTPPFAPLTRKQVEHVTGLPRTTIYEKMNPGGESFDPSFPLPLSFGPKKVRWRDDEVYAWMETRERRTYDRMQTNDKQGTEE